MQPKGFTVRACLPFITLALLAAPAAGGDTYWTSMTVPDDWFDGLNWTGGVPGVGDTAYVSNDGTAEIGTGAAETTLLYLGYVFGQWGTVSLVAPAGALSADTEYVGYNGTGIFQQDYGTNTVTNNLYLGHDTDGHGTYTMDMAGASLDVGGQIYVGYDGTGIFNLNAGVVTADEVIKGASGTFTSAAGSVLRVNTLTGFGTSPSFGGHLQMGHSGGTASYSLGAAESLSVGNNLAVGDDSTATFTQTGGTNTVGYHLNVGRGSGSDGTYTLSGTGVLQVHLDETVGFHGTGRFTQSGGTNTVTNSLHVGREDGSDGTYLLTAGQLEAGVDEHVGKRGTGTFTQDDGTHRVTNDLYLGTGATGHGTYTMGGGSLDVGGEIYVGSGGTGVFNLNGGVVTADEVVKGASGTFTSAAGATLRVNTLAGFGGSPSFGGSLEIGHSGGTGTGSYSLGAAESLSVDENLAVGYDAPGTFTQTGGTNTVTVSFRVGHGATGIGTYTMSDGDLQALWENIGYHGTGTFTQSGGTNTVGSQLIVGREPGSNGTYTLGGAGELTAPEQYVGYKGTGIFQQGGGTNTATTALILGDYGTGTYELSGTGVLEPAILHVGRYGTGTFIQSGGTNTVPSMALNTTGLGSGTYILSGGALEGGDESIGHAGAATFTHTGGTNTAGVWLVLGNTAGGDGTYELSGTGVLEAAEEHVGYEGMGTFTQSDGTNTVTSNLYLGYGATGHGTYTMNGGSLDVGGQLHVGVSGTGIFNLNAGGVVTADEVIQGGAGTFTSAAGSTLRVNTLTGFGATPSFGGRLDIGHSGGTGTGSYSLGAAESLSVGGGLIVGYDSTGTFTQTGGTNTAYSLTLGEEAGGSGTYTMSGGTLLVHHEGNHLGTGTWTQTGGTHTVSTDLYVGSQDGSVGTYTLSGTGDLDVGGTLTVGASGQGTLNVEAGADVNVAVDLNIGTDPASTADNTVTATGSGSTVTVGRYLNVGFSGMGTCDVLSGAEVVASCGGSIGLGVDSWGMVTVDGTNSVLSYLDGPSSGCNLGYDGRAWLNVTGGGLVHIQTPWAYVGARNTGDGTVWVDGGGGGTPSSLEVTTSAFYVGGSPQADGGGVGRMTISNGGQVLSNGIVIGGGTAGGVNGTGTVIVDGVGSLLDARYYGAEALWVGGEGNATLNVRAGGRVQAHYLAMGYEAGSETASMTVDGGNSSVDVTTGMNIGYYRAAHLTIQNGGQLVSGTDDTSVAVIGYTSTANGASITVDGAGSLWDHQGSASANHEILVGWAGGNPADSEWSMLNVTNGGKVLAHDLRAAGDSADGAGWVVVDGKDGANNPSTVSANGSVIIGGDAGGKLTVSGGGLFKTTTSWLHMGENAGGSGIVLVTGAGSTLQVQTSLVVGTYTDGELTVEDGGTVESGHGFIAVYSGSSGTVTVGDGGANMCTWDVGSDLYIGGHLTVPSNGAATLTVNPSGQVNVAGKLKMYGNTGGGSSTLNLNGGTISVGSTDIVSGFNFTSGTFRYTGSATLNTDTLDDLLGADPTLVADQELDVVGTATLSAPLRLNGGTFGVGSIPDLANLEFDAGTFNLTSDNLTVGAGGLLGTDPTIMDVQTVNVTNNVTIDTGSQFIVIGGYSSGATTNNGDFIIIDTTGSGKTIAGDLNTPAGSTVTLVGDITFTGAVSGDAGFYGPGTAHFDGGYNPGDSFAQVPFEGSVAFGATNTLFIEIGGTVAGDEYDQVNVAGQAMLDGTLAVSLIDPFVPAAGDAFTILTYDPRSGEFAAVTGWDHAELAHLAIYEANALTLHCTYFGDATLDGCVDGLDYNRWSLNYLQSGGFTEGDFNEDGIVDGLDYNAWSMNYLSGCAGAAVPEPALAVLLMAGLGPMLRRRRNR